MYQPYDKATASTTDRIAWALCQIIDDDAPVRWTRYRFAAECIAKNPDVMRDLKALAAVEQAQGDDELKAWREMFAAFAASGLPDGWPNPNPKLWPNNWPQDVAMVAFALHQKATPAPQGKDTYTLVKTETLKWLLGEGDDFECPESEYLRGKPAPYWWRKHLRKAMKTGAQP